LAITFTQFSLDSLKRIFHPKIKNDQFTHPQAILDVYDFLLLAKHISPVKASWTPQQTRRHTGVMTPTSNQMELGNL